MTIDHTSTALENIFANPLEPRTILAIQQKYRRMEQALQTLAGVHSAPGEGDGTDSYVRSTAEDALSFDPLND